MIPIEIVNIIEQCFIDYQGSNVTLVCITSGKIMGILETLRELGYDIEEYVERFQSLTDIRKMEIEIS